MEDDRPGCGTDRWETDGRAAQKQGERGHAVLQ